MKIPVDVSSVLSAIEETEKSRKASFRMHIFMEEAADVALREMVCNVFSSEEEGAKVFVDTFSSKLPAPDKKADLCIVVAGPTSFSASLYHQLLDDGFPTMVVTLCPNLLQKIAGMSDLAIDEADLVSAVSPDKVSATDEPQPFGEAEQSSLAYAMGQWLSYVYPDKRLAFANAFPFFRKALATESVKATAMQNGGIGLVAFIPGADMPLMTLNEAKMVLQIAAAYGQQIDKSRAKELIAVAGSGFMFRGIARQLVALIPALGSLTKAGIGYGGTVALGYTFIEYFEGNGDVKALLDKGVTLTKEIASGKRQLPLPSDLNEVKDNVLSAAEAFATRALPIAKGIVQVFVDNGLDGDKVAKASGKAVETLMGAALGKLR